jgi:hypothetical protein
MSEQSLQFVVRRHRSRLESFLRAIGGDVRLSDEDGDSVARILKGDGTVFPMSGLVDPVEMRELLRHGRIATPEYRAISDEEDITFFAMLDPPFMLRCGDETRFIQYGADTILSYNQMNSVMGERSMVLEHGVYGSGFWVCGFVEDGVFVFHGIVDLEWLSETYRFPMEAHVPSGLSDDERSRLAAISSSVVEALKLNDSPVRIEYNFVESEESFQVVEVDIGWFSEALPVDIFALSNEGSYWGNQIRMLNGEAVASPIEADHAVSIRWLHSWSGIVEEILHTDEASEMPGVLQVELCVETGDKLRHVVDVRSRDRLGYVVATGATSGEAQEVSQKAADRIYIQRKTIL